MEYEGFSQAYGAVLTDLLDRPAFRNAPRGFASQEVLGACFSLTDPLRRLVPSGVRRANIVFNFAEALWYFAGRDDLDYLAYYAPAVSRFVGGATTLTGTAYGPRIFRFGPERIDQWESVIGTLAADPDSKRAVVQIFQPEELLVPGNQDVACTLGLQFFQREERLHAVGYMRANDAYRGIVSDVFSFTFLQELLARRLGLELGTYTHMVGSLHLYEPDLRAARRYIAAAGSQPDDRMPPMPAGDPRADIDRVMVFEEKLRSDGTRLDPDSCATLSLPEYWRHVVVLFELYRTARYGGGRGTAALLGSLPPVYRHMVSARFPELAGGTVLAEEKVS